MRIRVNLCEWGCQVEGDVVGMQMAWELIAKANRQGMFLLDINSTGGEKGTRLVIPMNSVRTIEILEEDEGVE